MSNDSPTVENYNPANETTSTDTAPEGASTAPSTETAEEKAKRAYTSPRANFASEVLSYLMPLAKAWGEDVGAGSREDVLSVLGKIEAEVIRLRDHGRDKDVGDGTTRTRSSTPNPYQGKHWWVGQTEGGTLVLVDCARRPTPANVAACVGEGLTIAHLYGPMNTKAGAEYVVAHGLKDHHKQIF